MDKFIKNKIIMEFEIAIRDINDETLFKNIELLKSAAASDSQNDMCYQNICMELMQILTKEIKLKNKIQYERVHVLSEEERCFLSSIYG